MLLPPSSFEILSVFAEDHQGLQRLRVRYNNPKVPFQLFSPFASQSIFNNWTQYTLNILQQCSGGIYINVTVYTQVTREKKKKKEKRKPYRQQ